MLKKFALTSLLLSISLDLYSESVLTAGNEGYFKDLPSPYLYRFYEYTLKDIKIYRDGVNYRYCKDDNCFLLILSKEKRDDNLAGRSKNFFISYEGDISLERLSPLTDAIVKNDRREVFVRVTDSSPVVRYDLDLLIILYLLGMLVVGGIAISFIEGTNKVVKGLLIKIDRMPLPLYIFFFILVIVYAAQLRLKGIWLPVVDEGSAIRLLYSYGNPLYNLFISSDPRHPGLYFVILRLFLGCSDNPAFTARVISAIFSVVSVGVMGFVVMEKSRLFSIIAMLLLATNPEYIYRSREVTDISLFVMNSLLSIFFLRRAVSGERRRDYYLFFLFLLLSCLSSYAAYINLIAMILFLFISKKIRGYEIPVILMSLILTPSIIKISLSLPQEFHSREMATAFPEIIWGGSGLMDFVLRTIYNLVAGRYSIIILVMFIVYLILCYKNIKGEMLLVLLFVSNMLFFIVSLYLRMMPYYMLFFVVSLILLILSIRIDWDGALFNYLFTLIFSLFILYGFIDESINRYEATYIQSYHLRNDPAILVRTIKRTDVKEVVIDIENNKHILGFHLFDDPYKTLIKRGCLLIDNEMMECLEESSRRRITVLTRMLSIKRGWEERAVEKLASLTIRDFFFVYDRNSPDEVVLRWLDKNCKTVLLGEKYLLYRCAEDRWSISSSRYE